MSPAAAAAAGPGVVLVAGYGRSGSTLLDRLLGQVGGFVSVGEFYWLWLWSLGQNQRCGCGQPFRSCAFWTAVFDRAFGGFSGLDLDRAVALQAVCEGRRYGAQALLPGRGGAVAEYRDLLARVYRAVLDVAGARVVVDSSKFPARALVLGRLDGLSTAVVHVVRDSRAVAFSWQRTRRRPEIDGATELMPRRTPARTAAVWTVANTLLEAVARRYATAERLRYEDLLRDTASTLGRVASRLGETHPDLGFLRAGTAEMGVDHTVAGNPMRFQVGRVALAADEEWATAMRPRDRRLVTALTLPLLLRYGYAGRRSRRRAGEAA